QFITHAFESLQRIRCSQMGNRSRSGAMFYFLSAFILLSVFSSIATIFNAYWLLGFVLFALLLLYFSKIYLLNTQVNIYD
ncbi:MAG: hypothetical protein AAF975_05100, partial [Spirochaetota bacterium]